MRSISGVWLIALVVTCVPGVGGLQAPALQKGISVEMPTASHGVEMREADQPGATVVAVTADGRVFVGVEGADASTLGSLRGGTVYIKADARAPYQKVLAVIDALHGRPVVLLTAPPRNVKKGEVVPPYGMKLLMAQ